MLSGRQSSPLWTPLKLMENRDLNLVLFPIDRFKEYNNGIIAIND